MVTGRLQGYRDRLLLLGRAAGLSTFALATTASSACYTCTQHDDCARLDELNATRDAGVASSNASAGTAGAASELAKNVQAAKLWNGTSCPTPEEFRAIVQLKFPSRYADATLTEKSLADGQCCYHVEESDCGEGGRPFLVYGQPRIATLAGIEARPTKHPALAQAWLADALMEHASVAAFARLSLQLLALGAPADLVRDSQLASLDELRHADFCFEMASRHAGSRLRPGPLPVQGALDDLSLAGLVESNLLEGCIGETLAAEQLRRRADLVGDPQLGAALLSIAEDETRHAALAFRILAWCREAAPALAREVVTRVLAEERPSARAARASDHDADGAYVAERGDSQTRREGDEQTWQHVLSPLLSALSAPAGSPHSVRRSAKPPPCAESQGETHASDRTRTFLAPTMIMGTPAATSTPPTTQAT